MIEVGDINMNPDATVPPNVTPVTFVNPVPVIVIMSPPETDSVPGETFVTVGGAALPLPDEEPLPLPEE